MTDTLKSQLPVVDAFRAEYLEYYRMLPLQIVNGRLRVAVAGDPNRDALEDLSESYGVELDLEPVPLSDLQDAIRRTFADAESVVELVRDLDATMGETTDPGESPLTDVRDLANQPPVIRFVNLLIREAYDTRASDIHLDATRDGLRIRSRIDGVLSELPTPPKGLHSAIVSRIKLLGELDIAERRVPQDGRIRVRLEARELDLRISTVPTLFGESVVLRLLDRGGRPVTLEDLGMAPDTLEAFQRLARKQHGIVVATGPTGSGKTTTLYAGLALRDPTAEKIITVEDPVEYQLGGITQVPLHSRAGVTFAGALRSILRQDPDVIMVGEMRDRETAAIAIQAAMTGHLVFSTLHTNDAIAAIPRLTDLGVEPYLVGSSLNAVLAQRLARRTCSECRERYRPDPAVLELLAPRDEPPTVLERGAGCAACRFTGYRGRTGLFELLVISEEVRQALARGAEATALRHLAREQGMVTLREDGWRKVKAGITTVEEVLRVAGE